MISAIDCGQELGLYIKKVRDLGDCMTVVRSFASIKKVRDLGDCDCGQEHFWVVYVGLGAFNL